MSVVRASLAGNPGALPSPEKIELGLAEVQFPAVLSVFLVNIPSRSQFLPHPSSHSRYFYATSDNLRDPYFEKVGIRTPKIPRGPASESHFVGREPYPSYDRSSYRA